MTSQAQSPEEYIDCLPAYRREAVRADLETYLDPYRAGGSARKTRAASGA